MLMSVSSGIVFSHLRVDLYGDALGAAVLPNDRWRSAHDVFKHQICLDAKFLGVAVKQKVYGILPPQPGSEAATDHRT
jgi:hypothetical protein